VGDEREFEPEPSFIKRMPLSYLLKPLQVGLHSSTHEDTCPGVQKRWVEVSLYTILKN
jgi:hypothetical protein